ncbi:terminase DNA packaging enzyme large subunit [Pectobacterium phage vB_PcaM_CBB]|uniref:Terminase DNA packaging enzyme large subunit n=1 Tax=Pectobacterium phage vB_PcaM_CBB TaxID=2772511 RepID=A0A1L2CV01_9CAUD|nr:terminase DNA packaging enzyme large subunit [Pectobacterium phage vB_PcaM_CBB]AMM43838.1 terminase DNA packaging enzyme large subunit [Pectobacterium phage vB_PcaM_CBB]
MNNIREYILCRDDIFYFMEKYLKIELRGYQVDVLSKYWRLKTGKTANIQSIRGAGLSTINAIYSLWLLLFYPGTKIALIAPTAVMAENEKHIISRFYDIFVTNWDKDQTKYYITKYMTNKITFDSGSYIVFTWDLGNDLRGHSFDLIIYDSLFLNFHADECFKNTAPAGKKYIITNTQLSEKKCNMETYGEVSIYPWYCNPDLTQEWYSSMLNSLGNAEFEKRFGCTRGNSNGEF